MRPIATVWQALVPAASFYLVLAVVGTVFAVIMRSRRFTVVPALFVSVADAVLLYSVFLVGFLVAAPQPAAGVEVRVVPGNDLGVALQASPGDVLPWLQLLGNLLLLAPFGALAPVRFAGFGGWGRVLAGALAVTCGIEFLQDTVLTGRVVSADDVLLNTAGAVLGAVLTRPWWGELPRALAAARPEMRSRPRHALRPQYAR